MSDIFISYARPNEGLAKTVAELLRGQGYGVWRDDELPAHRAYSEVIEERILAAKAVVVLWSADARNSQWVRAEADAAREAGTLVQITLDGSLPPMPFNQIQCADLAGWSGDTAAPGWVKVMGSIGSLAGNAAAPAASAPASPASAPERRVVCVLPFLNMSGDAEQEYFSDGISEDVITDLGKVSALTIIARNTAFSFKGKTIDNAALTRDLGITHVLEGSVRKAAGRVRINAQLIDCRTGHQLWAERYDRELNDIFAIQDEISKAIVAALQLQLLPREKKAIEHRGTSSPEAYNLYLLARQHWVSGNKGDRRRDEVVVRICRQATAIDPDYARAWALMALAQSELRFWHGQQEIDALSAAQRALQLDPEIAEAYCVKARYLQGEGRIDEANQQLAEALRLDPESFEVNKETGHLTFQQGRSTDAIPYFEKATELMESNFHDPSMLITCYEVTGDEQNIRRVAQIVAKRVEKVVAQDPTNGFAIGTGAISFAVLGDPARAKEWIDRAMLIDPDNISMRYNLACLLGKTLGDADGAVEMLGPFLNAASRTQLGHCDVDPDIDPIRTHSRFVELRAKARARLGITD